MSHFVYKILDRSGLDGQLATPSKVTALDVVYPSRTGGFLALESLPYRLTQVILNSSFLDVSPADDSNHSQSKQFDSSQQPSPTPAEITYDVFISYNEADRPWVRDELLQKLEAAGFRVLDRFRDFEPGAIELTEVVRAVKSSRKTLLVLTPDWLQSDSNLYEIYLAQYPDRAALQRKVLPLKLKPCSLPETIPFLVAVDFTDPRYQEDEYKRLIRAIRETPRWWPRPFPPVSQKTAENSRNALLFGLLTVIILLVLPGAVGAIEDLRHGPLASIWPAPTATVTPIAPMPDSGFNIAVAQFTSLDNTISDQESKEFSEWLFAAIKNTVGKLPPTLRVTLREPADIGPIMGDTDEARDAHAAQIVAGHNATLLIYGIITRRDNDFYVQPTFYIAPDEASFDQGREITGPNRLGQPVPFTLPLDAPALAAANEKLLTRVQVLQHLVAGLAYFYIDKNEQAGFEFRQAAEVTGWQDGEGQEVVYLLQGATTLRGYGPAQSPELLIQAETAYSRAVTINPDYARSYLGLGNVAFQQATHTRPYDEAKLIEAQTWFEQSLAAPDQPPLAHISAKSAYGLGQVHLAGYSAGYSGWSADEAIKNFQQVIEEYETTQSPDLAWDAGPAHIYVGYLAGKNYLDWEKMVDEIKNGIEILENMPGAPQDWLALYWTWLAIAEENRKNLDAAHDAYKQAIELAEPIPESRRRAFTTADLEQWRAELKRLEGLP